MLVTYKKDPHSQIKTVFDQTSGHKSLFMLTYKNHNDLYSDSFIYSFEIIYWVPNQCSFLSKTLMMQKWKDADGALVLTELTAQPGR